MPFRDRVDAGQQLAARLSDLKLASPVVLGLPRGGVPVAAEVARRLHAPLDVLIVRKLGCPWQPELGIGAIGEDGARVLNHELIAQLAVPEAQLEAVALRETAELERRVRAYRGTRPPIPVAGKLVLLVDDGLATGFTARTAIEVLRRRGVDRVVLAVPVAPADTVEALRGVADDVVCLAAPALFLAIGSWYADFRQTSDEEVRRLLAASAAGSAAAPDTATAPAEGLDPAREVEIAAGRVRLPGTLLVPARPVGVVVFAHGSGSSRFSPRNIAVAGQLQQVGLATLLFDLLTPDEALARGNVFDIALLAERLRVATAWLARQPEVAALPVGYFGASTGAAAALQAAADLGDAISAIVSRGGRPDLAGPSLATVSAPTLLIVGGRDDLVLELNRRAQQRMQCATRLAVIPDAGHLFEEPGALAAVGGLAADWFLSHVRAPEATPDRSQPRGTPAPRRDVG
jgi:putative phosphoribosyl transferase